jgi:hypothetical protein
MEQPAFGSSHFLTGRVAKTWDETGASARAPTASKSARRNTSPRKYGPRPPSLIGRVDRSWHARIARTAELSLFWNVVARRAECACESTPLNPPCAFAVVSGLCSLKLAKRLRFESRTVPRAEVLFRALRQACVRRAEAATRRASSEKVVAQNKFTFGVVDNVRLFSIATDFSER